MKTGALISDCGKYRYRLWRRWNEALPHLLFIMLNPSTADASKDDRTITRCIRKAYKLRYGGIEVVNLFAFRATDPDDLMQADEPIGTENDGAILSAVEEALDHGGMVICAWGGNAAGTPREKYVLDILNGVPLFALRVNADGTPAHPLYLPESLDPVEFDARPVEELV